MKIPLRISNRIALPRILPELDKIVTSRLTILTPEYRDALKFKRPTRGIKKYIRLYEEDSKYIYLPRGYLDELLLECLKFELEPDIVWETAFFDKKELKQVDLWDYQIPWYKNLKEYSHGVGIAPPGCHPKGTRVLLSNGKAEKIENIKEGDRLIGKNGFRTVLSLCRGRGPIYEIIPEYGEPFKVNDQHCLTLKQKTSRGGRHTLYDIKLCDFLKLSKQTREGFYLTRLHVPRFEGKKKNSQGMYEEGKRFGESLQDEKSKRRVKESIRTSSFEARLEFFAGLLDSASKKNHNENHILISPKHLKLRDISFVARSLGFYSEITSYLDHKKNRFYRLCLEGDFSGIPFKKSSLRPKNSYHGRDPLETRIRDIRLVSEEDNFYGFNLDGDKRYLLEDFTWTHNSGKTAMGIAVYANLGQPCLWLTHTKGLARQAADRLKMFVGEEAGLIGAGVEDVKHFTVGLIPTLTRRDISKYASKFGTIILDESQHAPAPIFTDTLQVFKAHNIYGVTATPYREDGLEQIMFDALGPARCVLEKRVLREMGKLMLPSVIRRPSKFYFDYDHHSRKKNWHGLQKAIALDEGRNKLIASDVASEVFMGTQSLIVLISTKRHGEALYNEISPLVPEVGFYHSGMRPKAQEEVVNSFLDGKLKVLIATYKMLAEGFDYPPASRLFLAGPCKSRTMIEQAIGRIERVFEGKTSAIVYDYIDPAVSVLLNQAETRLDIYDMNELSVKTI